MLRTAGEGLPVTPRNSRTRMEIWVQTHIGICNTYNTVYKFCILQHSVTLNTLYSVLYTIISIVTAVYMQYSEMSEFTSVNTVTHSSLWGLRSLVFNIASKRRHTLYEKHFILYLLHAPFSPFQQRVRHQSVHFLWLDARWRSPLAATIIKCWKTFLFALFRQIIISLPLPWANNWTELTLCVCVCVCVWVKLWNLNCKFDL